MTLVRTSRPLLSWALGGAGLAAGVAVNLAGFAAAAAGWGLWLYMVLVVLAVMGGAAAWRSARSRWFGAGLTAGAAVSFVVLWVLALVFLK